MLTTLDTDDSMTGRGVCAQHILLVSNLINISVNRRFENKGSLQNSNDSLFSSMLSSTGLESPLFVVRVKLQSQLILGALLIASQVVMDVCCVLLILHDLVTPAEAETLEGNIPATDYVMFNIT